MNPLSKIASIVLIATCLLSVNQAQAGHYQHRAKDTVGVKYERHEQRADKRQDNRLDARAGHVKVRPVHPAPRRPVVVPRNRHVRNIVVIRPHGHAYWGYGHFHADEEAWKWLAFTAITLKLLDNIDEASQRAHEAAQIKASEAAVGEVITWQTDNSSGTVVTTKQGVNQQGLTCREFQQTVTIGGQSEMAYGTACLQADGSWKMV